MAMANKKNVANAIFKYFIIKIFGRKKIFLTFATFSSYKQYFLALSLRCCQQRQNFGSRL
jgi:hypothetical protein